MSEKSFQCGIKENVALYVNLSRSEPGITAFGWVRVLTQRHCHRTTIGTYNLHLPLSMLFGESGDFRQTSELELLVDCVCESVSSLLFAPHTII